MQRCVSACFALVCCVHGYAFSYLIGRTQLSSTHTFDLIECAPLTLALIRLYCTLCTVFALSICPPSAEHLLFTVHTALCCTERLVELNERRSRSNQPRRREEGGGGDSVDASAETWLNVCSGSAQQRLRMPHSSISLHPHCSTVKYSSRVRSQSQSHCLLRFLHRQNLRFRCSTSCARRTRVCRRKWPS